MYLKLIQTFKIYKVITQDIKTLKIDSERSERVITENNNYTYPEIEEYPSPDELIEQYQEVEDDISYNFNRFECADHELDKYAYWEQQGKTEWVYKVHPILGTYGFERPRREINSLIENHNLTEKYGIEPISDNDTMEQAHSISQAVLNALQSILEHIKEWFAKLTGKDIDSAIQDKELEKDNDEPDYDY